MPKIKDRLSPSLASRLLTTPMPRLVWEIENDNFEATPAMMRGNRWEHILHTGNLDDINVFTETKTRGVNFDKWSATIDAPDYLKVTESEYEEDKLFFECSRKHAQLIKDLHYSQYQNHLEYEDEHCYLDFLHIDTNRIYELKCISDSHDFKNKCFRNNYDLQCYMQLKLGGWAQAFYWLTIDTKAPYVFTLWKATPEVIESGRKKYEKARELFDAMNNGDYNDLETYELEVPNWQINQHL